MRSIILFPSMKCTKVSAMFTELNCYLIIALKEMNKNSFHFSSYNMNFSHSFWWMFQCFKAKRKSFSLLQDLASNIFHSYVCLLAIIFDVFLWNELNFLHKHMSVLFIVQTFLYFPFMVEYYIFACLVVYSRVEDNKFFSQFHLRMKSNPFNAFLGRFFLFLFSFECKRIIVDLKIEN